MVIFILVIGIAILILVHELGHFLVAKLFKVKVEEFGIGFPPRLFSKKKGETRYSFNLLPLGGFVRLYGESGSAENLADEKRSFIFQPAWRRVVIIGAGVVMNFLLGWFILSAVFAIGASPKLVIMDVAKDSPAQTAGFKSGDIISDFRNSQSFIDFIDRHKGEETTLSIERANGAGRHQVTVQAVPRQNPPAGEGALGVAISEFGIEKLPLLPSIWEGLKKSIFIIGAIFAALGKLIADVFTGTSAGGGFVGPVGIYTVASETARFGILQLFQLIAIISLNLTVLNILPIPALDGGRLLFIIIEKIKGLPVPHRRETLAHAIGFIIMIIILIAVTIHDVINIL